MEKTDQTASDALKGVIIVISGNFSIPRDEMKALIEKHGGKNSSSISAKTTYLLAGSKPGPEKIKKAAELAVKVISEEDFMRFRAIIESYFEYSELLLKNEKEPIYYMPINISSGKKIGYLKINKKATKSDFIEFISNNGDVNDMCFFDIIILMNLIANRTYLDLNQYPIFPVLFFYDKTNKTLERNFKLHIGFQTLTNEGKKRCELTKENYDYNKKSREDEEQEEKDDEDDGKQKF